MGAEEILKQQVEAAKERMAKRKYQRQYYPGSTMVPENRRKFYDPIRPLEVLRTLTDEDFQNLLGFRALGQRYLSVHPPLEEIGEPDDPIRELVPADAGAKAGDRITTMVMSDSLTHPLIGPYTRIWMYLNRFRGIDGASYSARTTLEMREREMEGVSRVIIEAECFDPARDAFRQFGCTGASSRLDKNGLFFDPMARIEYDPSTGHYMQVKDGFGIPLDKPVDLGPTLPEEEKAKRNVMYMNTDGNPVLAGPEWEVLVVKRRIQALRFLAGMGPYKLNGK
ncbi:MAG: coenzyme-B sulfoethylthiotransferase subunit gamma [Methanobacteriota archaeon]|uniref:coenzyme-B sulfoethylthiotransferase n=1 Tax=Candidatus Syntropharchaeum caldarium TaxID=1838285 RepID=A0A1F2PCA4_9EURY|nr:MAG: methyl coenzyme M reductase subunit gamma [Candidatus Syntrophoarchaeum caldarius]RLG68936.1 MAG: coenzyme-B sulfoethylthiotransferase subunit gamma [Euryarchaeota archaeon]